MKTLPRVRQASARPNWLIFWIWTHKNIPDRRPSVSFKIRKNTQSLHPSLQAAPKKIISNLRTLTYPCWKWWESPKAVPLWKNINIQSFFIKCIIFILYITQLRILVSNLFKKIKWKYIRNIVWNLPGSILPLLKL